MNGNQYFASRYQEVDVSTSTSVHLVVMLYDAAITSLEEARGHMERKDIEGRSRALNKCNNIISELQSSLDMRNGGAIASSLNRLYDYMKTTLFRAGVEQNPGLVVEVSGLLENLRSAWRQIDSGAAVSTPKSDEMEFIPKNAGFTGSPPVVESGYGKSFSISA
jgi:flagellar protein FliS